MDKYFIFYVQILITSPASKIYSLSICLNSAAFQPLMYFLLLKHVCFDIKVSLVFDMGDRSSSATPNFGGQSKE